jgi:hypothetical protein
MCILGPITAPKRLHQADNLPAFLKTLLHEWKVHEVGKERVRGDEQMPTWNQDPQSPAAKLREKSPKVAAIKRRGNPPDPASPLSELLLLHVRILL